MRKFFAITLAVIMMMAMATTAFAAEETVTGNGSTKQITVNAQYQDGVTVESKISVNVAWGEMSFTYSVGGTKTWDAVNHQYKEETTDNWSAEGNTVTVTNHSDSAIKVEFSFQAKDAYNTVTGTFDNAVLNLPTAYGKTKTDTSLIGTSTLTLGGTLASSVTSATEVGTITLTISK